MTNLTRFSDHEEYPRAYIVLNVDKKVTEQELHTWFNKQVTFTKRLTGGIRFVESIPKNPVSTCTVPRLSS
jgi:4-coumarate--CoA ligase